MGRFGRCWRQKKRNDISDQLLAPEYCFRINYDLQTQKTAKNHENHHFSNRPIHFLTEKNRKNRKKLKIDLRGCFFAKKSR